MKKNLVSTLLVTSFLLASAIIAVSGRSTEGEVPAPPAIGSTLDDFTLPDASGKEQSLGSLKGKIIRVGLMGETSKRENVERFLAAFRAIAK